MQVMSSECSIVLSSFCTEDLLQQPALDSLVKPAAATLAARRPSIVAVASDSDERADGNSGNADEAGRPVSTPDTSIPRRPRLPTDAGCQSSSKISLAA